MSARVLLVSINTYTQPYPVYPLALAFLRGALLRAGHKVTLWDSLVSKLPLEEAVARAHPDVVGISLRNIDNVQSHRVVSFVNELGETCDRLRALTAAPLVLGGSGFSLFPRELLALSRAHFGITGEGEAPFVRLVEELAAGRTQAALPGQIIPCAGPENGFTHEPAHDPELVRAYGERAAPIGIQTHRGCPLHCCYCTYPLLEGARTRYRPVESILEEVRTLRDLGTRYVFFVDSVFNLDARQTEALVEGLASAGGMEWGAFLRPTRLSRELTRRMHRAGMRHAEFGSDSLSDPVLEAYGKQFSYREIQEAHRAATSAGLHVSHFLIAGGPGETRASLDETLKRADELGGLYFAVAGMRIYPHTPLWQKDSRAESAELLEPTYYFSPQTPKSWLQPMLAEHAAARNNWVLGDPPPHFEEVRLQLHRKGHHGPNWEYIDLLQRFDPPAAGR